jgi:hypothetical protein
MTNIFDGAVVTFSCVGDKFLDGLTAAEAFGGVNLAPTDDNVSSTGTHWQLSKVAGTDAYTIACAGSIPGPRYLNGNTFDGTVNLVGDMLDPYSGTQWVIQDAVGNGVFDQVFLYCAGSFSSPSYIYLQGQPFNNTVGMAPNTGPRHAGTHWATKLVALPTLSVTTRRELTASLLDITGTNFNGFDRVLFAAEAIVGRVDHVPLAIGNDQIVNVDTVGAFRTTHPIVVDRVREQPYEQPVIIRATDQHGVSAVAPSNGFSY